MNYRKALKKFTSPRKLKSFRKKRLQAKIAMTEFLQLSKLMNYFQAIQPTQRLQNTLQQPVLKPEWTLAS